MGVAEPLEPTDFFKILEYPCPDEDFYAYGIDGDGFYLTRIDGATGELRWYHSADGITDFDDSLNSWAGYGGGTSTSQGYFVLMMDQAQGADGNGFYLVRPDGTPVGGVMEVPRNVSTGWGQDVVEDANGDHYAAYYTDADENDILLAGWSGIETEKWRVIRSQLPDPPRDWVTAGSLALAPDGKTLVAGFVFGYLAGIDTTTGEILWTFQIPDADFVMDQCALVRFAPQGHLWHIGDTWIPTDEFSGDTMATLWRLDFPDGYRSEPTLTRSTYLAPEVVGSDSEPFGLVVLEDGSAIVNFGHWELGFFSDTEDARMARISDEGNVIWDVSLTEQKPGYLWEVYYSPLCRIGDRVFASLLNEGFSTVGEYADRYHVTPVDIETGEVDLTGTAWPQGRWMIGAGGVKREDSADCRPDPDDYFKILETSGGAPDYFTQLERPGPVPGTMLSWAIHVRNPSAEPEDGKLMFFDTAGSLIATVPTEKFLGDSVFKNGEVTMIGEVIARWNTDGLVWDVRDMLPSGISGQWGLAVGNDGAAYFVAYHTESSAWRIEPDGSAVNPIISFATAMPGFFSERLAISDDDTVIYFAGWNNDDREDVGIAAARISDGAGLFNMRIPMPNAEWNPIFGSISDRNIARIPGTDSLVYMLQVWKSGGGLGSQVVRLDFESGIESEPTIAWNVVAVGGASISNIIITEDAIYVTTGNEIARLTLDGSIVWTTSGLQASWPYAFSAYKDRLLVRIYDPTRFNQHPYPGGGGYVMLDASTGEEIPLGEFPYEPHYAETIARTEEPVLQATPDTPATSGVIDFFTGDEV